MTELIQRGMAIFSALLWRGFVCMNTRAQRHDPSRSWGILGTRNVKLYSDSGTAGRFKARPSVVFAFRWRISSSSTKVPSVAFVDSTLGNPKPSSDFLVVAHASGRQDTIGILVRTIGGRTRHEQYVSAYHVVSYRS